MLDSLQTNGGANAPAGSLPNANGEVQAPGEEASRPAAEGPAKNALAAKPLEKSGSAILGDIVWLLAQSPRHKHLFLADLEWLVMPPVTLKQFKVFYADRRPVAVALWASVSEEVEARLLNGLNRLTPVEWKTGNCLWLVELIAPSLESNSSAMERLLSDLTKSVFAERTFKYRRLNGKTGQREIISLSTKRDSQDGVTRVE